MRDEITRWIDAKFGNAPASLNIEPLKQENTNLPQNQDLLVELTDILWDETIGKQTRPIVVMFYSPSCPFCRQIEPYVVNYAKEFHETILFGHLNVLTNMSIIERYGIRQTPTFKIFCSGKPVFEMVGAIYPTMLKKMLDVVQDHGKECTSSSTAVGGVHLHHLVLSSRHFLKHSQDRLHQLEELVSTTKNFKCSGLSWYITTR